MSANTRSLCLAASLMAMASLVGCGSEHGHAHGQHDHESGQHDHGTAGQSAQAHTDSHAKDHGDEGPHGGHLIELGRNHAYHAELVEIDATQSIVVYILDSQMQEVSIDHDTISIHVAIDNRASSYVLKAAEGETAGGFSRFVSVGNAMFEALEHNDDLEGKLRVTIKGVPYVGRLAHRAHGHAGHQH